MRTPKFSKRPKAIPLLEWLLSQCSEPDENGCRVWERHLNRGQAVLTNSTHGTHAVPRIIWMELHGAISDTIKIRRKCRKGSCCEPSHFYQWTPLTKVAKPGYRHGEASPRSKLKDADILEIRSRLHRGHLRKSVAIDYSVDVGTVADIQQGRTWKHLL